MWLSVICVSSLELPRWCGGKAPACQCRKCKTFGLDPGVGRCPGEGNGNPLRYSCLDNFMNRRAWWLGVTRSQTTELLHTHAYPLWRNVYSSPLPFFWLRPKAWRILFPWPEVELGPRPLASKVCSSDHGTSHLCSFLVKLFVLLLLNSVVVENMFWILNPYQVI